MKPIVMCVVLSLAAASPVLAQQTTQAQPDPNELVVMPRSELTPEQLQRLQTQQITQQLGQYSEWAEMGRGIGLAVGESLRAVRDVAVDFSATDVGKFAMFLIAWKIMAQDIIGMGDQIFGYIVGIPTLFFGAVVLVWSYRRQCIPRRVLIKKSKEGGKEWAMFYPGGGTVRLDYETEDEAGNKEKIDKSVEARTIWGIGHGVAAFILIFVCSIMIFGC